MSATQDIVPGFDPSAQAQVSGNDLYNMVAAATPIGDTGFVIETADAGVVPSVPDAVTHTKLQRYLWRRLLTSSVTVYTWNPAAASDATYLKWQSITITSLADGAVTNTKIATGAVTDDKIADVSWGKITGAPSGFPPTGAAAGSLSGTYPNPGIAANAVTSAELSSDGTVDANRAVGTNHIKNASVTLAKLGADVTGATTPPGAIMAFATQAIPTGWLYCNGSEYLIANAVALSAAIYVGDGQNADGSLVYGYKTDGVGNRTIAGNYIKLPDLRGEFLRGLDDSRGVDTGRTQSSAQVDANKAHTHFIANGDTINVNTDLDATKRLALIRDAASARDYELQGSATAATIGLSSSSGSESRPVNVAVKWCIKT